MQTTLLGLAIAVILALVAALIGPSFIDWNQFKPQFEAEASRVIGAPVRVEGALDARLLPAPILRLHSLSVGAPGDATRMKAAKLDVEFSLSSLMRGEVRATQLALDGVALDLGLDKDGRVIAPSKGQFDFGALAIDRLDLKGGITVHDAASGSNISVNDIAFNGDVRALGSNMRGSGSFATADGQQPFRLAMSQAADGKGARIRLDLDPAKDGAVGSGIDGVLTFDQRAPRFDGSVTLARQGEQPWRMSTKVKAAPGGASFEQAEILYGAEDTGMKLAGSGELSIGGSPQLRALLSAQQLDADRALTKGDARANVLPTLRALMASLPRLPVTTQIDLGVDRLMLGGRAVQSMSARVHSAKDNWTVDTLVLTAPGTSRIVSSGVINPLGEDASFSGKVDIQTREAKSFIDWIRGRQAVYRGDMPARVKATVTLRKDGLVLDGMDSDIAGDALQGTIALTGSALDAALKSPSFNVDAKRDFLAVLTDAGLPSQARIALDFAKAKVAGRDLQPLSFDVAYKADNPVSLSKASVDLTVKRADLSPWFGASQKLTDLTSNLVIADNKVSLADLHGKLNGSLVTGNVAVTSGDATTIEGSVEMDAIDARTLIGLALGASGHDAAEPLADGWFGPQIALQIAAKAVALPGGAALTSLAGTLKSDRSSLALDDLKGTLGGGEMLASLQARRVASGTSVNADIKLTNADASALTYRSLALPEGRASLQVTLASEGRSTMALTNALSGNGVLTLKDARISGLNPAAFDAAIRAADDPSGKGDPKAAALSVLDSGSLAIRSVQVPFTIKEARFIVDPTVLETENARATISGGYDLAADQADIRAALRSTSQGISVPEIQIFAHGTPDGLQRSVDVSLLASWLSMRAIERETKRLDDLEKNGRPTPALPRDVDRLPDLQPPATASAPTDVRTPDSDPRKRKPLVRRPVAKPALGPNVTASGQQTAPLPPPIDIRPLPGSARPVRVPALPPPGTTF